MSNCWLEFVFFGHTYPSGQALLVTYSSVIPSLPQTIPAGHGSQSSSPSNPVVMENVPGGHLTQDTDVCCSCSGFPDRKVPLGQIIGIEVLSAAHECPEGHGMHVDDPKTEVNVP